MNMKTISVIQKVMLMLCALFVVSACSYDDEEIWNKVNEHEERISALEDWQKQVNSNITALQELLNTQDYITKVSPLMENGVEIGYSIHFAKSDSIALYHGTKGADGADGYVPAISVKRDTDGIYYWTLDGDWLTDSEGHKIKAEGTDGKDGADGEDGKDGQDGEDGKDGHNGSNGHNGTDGRDGITPKLKIEEGTWYVSYDKGRTWEKLGVAIIEEGGESTSCTCTCPITDVDVQDEKVVFTLDSGDEFEVPYYETSSELIITFAETTIELEAGGTAELTYTLSYNENVKVSAIGEGVRTEISNGKLIITATSENFEGGKVLVHATDGENVATVELTITKMMITYIEYTATEQIVPKAGAFGGKGVRFLEEKSTFEDGKGKWAYKGVVTSVGSNAFNNESRLTGITIPETVTFIDQFAFSKTGIKEITVPESVTTLSSSAFDECKSLTKATINAQIETLDISTFLNCTALEEVTLPESLKTIKRDVFVSCSSLKSITIPDNVTTIGEAAFSRCNGLKEIIIGDGVTTIEKEAFQDCGAETIVLGKSVSSIGNNAFNNRSSYDDYYKNLKSITCKGETPATLGTTPFPVSGGWNTYNYKIYVPSNAVQAYKSAWSDYSSKIQAITE